LCEVTPPDDVQNTLSFRPKHLQIQQPTTALFGANSAEAIPSPQLDESDLSRITQAIRNSIWGTKVQGDLESVRDSVEAVKATQEEVKTTADNIKVRVDTVNTNVNAVDEKVANIERPIPELKSEISRLTDQGTTDSYLSIASIVVMILAVSLIGYLTYMVLALKHELQEVTSTTPEDVHRIVEYIQRMQTRGYEIPVIKKELIKEGFSRAAIDMAVKQIQ
jgi:septal ring factor EnvC (AmiA/AmiB activator)